MLCVNNMKKILILLLPAFIINCFAPDLLFCHKCIEVMASIEVVDSETNQYIANPEIEIVCHSNKKIRNRIVNQDVIGDSLHIRIEGKPGRYSFFIRKEGYNEIKIENLLFFIIYYFNFFSMNAT